MSALVRQFGHPEGLLGSLAGLIMRWRPSNRLRNRWTLELLDLRQDDRVLEVGFGPGLALRRAAELAHRGRVVGLDHSELMVRQARRRNARTIASGLVDLRLGSVEHLPDLGGRFEKVFGVNVFMFWKDPVAVLTGLRAVMEPGATMGLTHQARHRGATADDTRAGAARIADALRAAGFDEVRVELLELAPVAAACVLARAP